MKGCHAIAFLNGPGPSWTISLFIILALLTCYFKIIIFIYSNTTYGITGVIQNMRLRETIGSTCPTVKPDLRDCLPNTLFDMLVSYVMGGLNSTMCLFNNL